MYFLELEQVSSYKFIKEHFNISETWGQKQFKWLDIQIRRVLHLPFPFSGFGFFFY